MALVLVPGFMTDKAMWASFEDEMAEFRPIVHADLSIDDSISAMGDRGGSAPIRAHRLLAWWIRRPRNHPVGA
jgi:hypothetical protein